MTPNTIISVPYNVDKFMSEGSDQHGIGKTFT